MPRPPEETVVAIEAVVEHATIIGFSGVTVVCDRTGIDWTIGTNCEHATKTGCAGDAVGCNDIVDGDGVIGVSVEAVGCNSGGASMS